MRVVLVLLALVMWAGAILQTISPNPFGGVVAATLFGFGSLCFGITRLIGAVLEVRDRLPAQERGSSGIRITE